ncbi:MAG: creatininase family protein [Acidibacillus sp.]|uniref:Mycofactocin system creatinine amidohydrolase family protein MftE n=1 Tax=Sulfoacidibacillus ferrooxidans TaxID=2005001 RepID=A0A9X2AEN9_9BACL|nr:creatininase family protein [Sulfoacidibacillus ferrooxidans]MCI0183537.1 putative mycofactocin system creatinine amidohydrolase family protein MftE [Sulfoacidibacillus ferrooxidans]MCY0892141.1 creatininase family protein [Acidibacillus sp.]
MYMHELNMTSFTDFAQRVDTVLIPIGMIEAHGPHCSLSTDILIPREFVRRLNPLIGDRVLMAPEIPYGHSFGLAPFAGTIDIPGEVFGAYVFEVAKAYLKQGMQNVVLFNGHGGNMSSLSLVSEKLADHGATVLTINWWVDYRAEIVKYAPVTGHAGEDETSAVLAIDPALVDMRLGVSNHTITTPSNLKMKDMGKQSYPQAYSGHAGAATAEKGEQIYTALLPKIIADIEQMWKYSR